RSGSIATRFGIASASSISACRARSGAFHRTSSRRSDFRRACAAGNHSRSAVIPSEREESCPRQGSVDAHPVRDSSGFGLGMTGRWGRSPLREGERIPLALGGGGRLVLRFVLRLDGVLEVAKSLAEAPAELRKLAGSEDDDHDQQDDQEL